MHFQKQFAFVQKTWYKGRVTKWYAHGGKCNNSTQVVDSYDMNNLPIVTDSERTGKNASSVGMPRDGSIDFADNSVNDF